MVAGFAIAPFPGAAGYFRGYVAPSGSAGLDFTPQAAVPRTTANTIVHRIQCDLLKLIDLSYLHGSVIANVLSHQQFVRALDLAQFRQNFDDLQQSYQHQGHQKYLP